MLGGSSLRSLPKTHLESVTEKGGRSIPNEIISQFRAELGEQVSVSHLGELSRTLRAAFAPLVPCRIYSNNGPVADEVEVTVFRPASKEKQK
jgi:hypothetical protein